jgi:hypothetical protein
VVRAAPGEPGAERADLARARPAMATCRDVSRQTCMSLSSSGRLRAQHTRTSSAALVPAKRRLSCSPGGRLGCCRVSPQPQPCQRCRADWLVPPSHDAGGGGMPSPEWDGRQQRVRAGASHLPGASAMTRPGGKPGPTPHSLPNHSASAAHISSAQLCTTILKPINTNSNCYLLLTAHTSNQPPTSAANHSGQSSGAPEARV